jgi:TatD DNase family protein
VAPRIDAPIVDAHAHTWSSEFTGDYAETIARAWAAGLVAVIEVGGDVPTSEQALAVARRDPERVFAVAGVHPHDAKDYPDQRDRLAELVRGGGFVGVGEIGLDFYRNLSPPEAQYEALRSQLALALAASLPVVIHSRNADEECYAEIETWARRAGRYLGNDREIGMMHCYAGDAALAGRYNDLGFLISIPGPVTYPRNDRGHEVARTIPLRSMLVETDSPSLTPQSRRGKRNEPAFIVETIEKVAELRGCTAEEVARATAENAARLFGFELRA